MSTLTPGERALVRATVAETRDVLLAKVQEILAASDQEAAANGNLWWQGRISGLRSAEEILAGEEVTAGS